VESRISRRLSSISYGGCETDYSAFFLSFDRASRPTPQGITIPQLLRATPAPRLRTAGIADRANARAAATAHFPSRPAGGLLTSLEARSFVEGSGQLLGRHHTTNFGSALSYIRRPPGMKPAARRGYSPAGAASAACIPQTRVAVGAGSAPTMNFATTLRGSLDCAPGARRISRAAAVHGPITQLPGLERRRSGKPPRPLRPWPRHMRRVDQPVSDLQGIRRPSRASATSIRRSSTGWRRPPRPPFTTSVAATSTCRAPPSSPNCLTGTIGYETGPGYDLAHRPRLDRTPPI